MMARVPHRPGNSLRWSVLHDAVSNHNLEVQRRLRRRMLLTLDLVITVAPEVALGWCYNEKCDVFSFGIVMWQIMGLQTNPYGTSPQRNNIQFFTRDVWQGRTVRPSMRFKKRTSQIHFSPEMQQLVTLCWSHRWQNRPAMVMVEATLCDLIESRNRSEKTFATVAMAEEGSLPYDSPRECSGGPSAKVPPSSSSTSSPSPHGILLGCLSRPIPGKRDHSRQ